MPLTTVTTEKGDVWALITLSSPGGLNKLGSETLIPLLQEVRTNLSDGCRCLGITGFGDSFAVGADLKEIGGLTPATAREFSDLGNSIFRLLENSDAMVESRNETVELDREMVKLTENTLSYQALLQAMSKRGDIIKMAVKEGRQ